MNKKLGLFIVIAIILIVIVGTIGIKEVMEPASSEIVQREVEEFGIEAEGQIYVIGEHLFTDKIEYLSTEMMLEAAKTVEGISEDMTEEQILNQITVYARDAEGNWINALTGENITLDSNFKFNIKYIDLIKIPQKVSTEEEFMTAFEDDTVNLITLANNINITKTLEIAEDRELTLNLNGKAIDISNIADSSFGFTVNGGTLTINGPGEITSNTNTKVNIGNMSGILEVNNVKMLGGYNILANFKNQGGQTRTTVNNSELVATAHTSVGTWENATLDINNSTLIGYYSAVATNGTAKSANINIYNCNMSTTCEEEGCVAYMPCGGVMNIEDSILTGHTGLGACAGTVNVTNTKINAIGKHWTLDEVKKLGSEMWCEGSSVILRSQKGYDNGGKLTLNIDKASTISSTNGPAIRIHEYKDNTAVTDGVKNIEVNYYSENSTCNSSFDKVLTEKLEDSFVTIEINDLSE